MQDYLDALLPTPAARLDLAWNIRKWNSAFARLLTGIHLRPNLMQWHYFSPEARDVIINWEETSEWCIGWLRMYAAQHPKEAALQAVLTSLMAIQDFSSRWDALVIPPDPNTRRWLTRDVENDCEVTLDMRVWLPAHPEDGTLLMGAIIS